MSKFIGKTQEGRGNGNGETGDANTSCTVTDNDELAVNMAESEDEVCDETSREFSLTDSVHHERHQSHPDVPLPTTGAMNSNESVDDSAENDFESSYSQQFQFMTSEVGTPYYVAPEVLKQLKQEHQELATIRSYASSSNHTSTTESVGYTTKCDIWSIGVLAFLTLTGTFPVMGDDERETLQKLMDPGLEVDFSEDTLWPQDAEDINCNDNKDSTVDVNEDEQGETDDATSTGKKKARKISKSALQFCKALLQRDPEKRPTARDALQFDWIVKHCGGTASTQSSTAMTVAQNKHRGTSPLPSLSTSVIEY